MILALLGAGMMMGQDSCATEEGKPVAQQDNGSQQDEETVKAEPDGTFRMNCDYLLGDFTEGSETGYKFVAGGGCTTRATLALWRACERPGSS